LLASGSRGNCTYVGDGRRGVLVDCGLATGQVLSRLGGASGSGDTRIDAVLLTHEHSDHVGAARILDDRLFRRQGERVPFHLTRGCAAGLHPRCVPQNRVRVVGGTPFGSARSTWSPGASPTTRESPSPTPWSSAAPGWA